MRRWAIGGIVLGVLGLGALLYIAGQGLRPAAVLTPTPTRTAAKVTAEGRVEPRTYSRLSFKIPGRIAELLVQEGDPAAKGQVLARLDTQELGQGVRVAEAALRGAEASLNQLLAGSRSEDLTTAEANLTAAEAKLLALKKGPRPEQLETAQKRIEQAKNGLWAAQTRRDAVCGNPQFYPGTTCDTENANVGAAHSALAIAEAQLKELTAPPTAEDLAQAEAQVVAARERLKLLQSPYTAPEVAAAQARVGQAQATLKQTRAGLAGAELVAPYDGTVASLPMQVGDLVQPGNPALVFADLSQLVVKTTDLDEAGVARLAVGHAASLTFFAFSNKAVSGRIESITPLPTITSAGDANYTVTIVLDRPEPALRWGMMAKVEFSEKD